MGNEIELVTDGDGLAVIGDREIINALAGDICTEGGVCQAVRQFPNDISLYVRGVVMYWRAVCANHFDPNGIQAPRLSPPENEVVCTGCKTHNGTQRQVFLHGRNRIGLVLGGQNF